MMREVFMSEDDGNRACGEGGVGMSVRRYVCGCWEVGVWV